MTKAKVIQEKIFFPYRPYFESAEFFCEKEPLTQYDLMAAITLLSLSIEAMANTIGHLVIPDFKDFENSSPIAKVRIICEATDLMLVNDLDLRVINSSGTTNFPWVLNPASPSSSATTGDSDQWSSYR